MTHAALKDLIYGIASRVEQASRAIHDSTRWDEEEMEDGVTISDWIFAPAFAALSAMEGEAAVEILGWKDNASPRLRFLTKVDRLTAGTILYTAPPPRRTDNG